MEQRKIVLIEKAETLRVEALGPLEKLKTAFKYYLEAIKIAPKFSDPYYNLSELLRGMGKVNEAEAMLKKAKKFDVEEKRRR